MTFCTSPPVPVEEIYPIVPTDVKRRYFPIAICDGVTTEQLQNKPLNSYLGIVQARHADSANEGPGTNEMHSYGFWYHLTNSKTVRHVVVLQRRCQWSVYASV